jgi:hypothetical protein
MTKGAVTVTRSSPEGFSDEGSIWRLLRRLANGGQPARAELAAPAFAGLTLEKSELSPSAMVG